MSNQDRVRIGIRLAPPTDVSAWLVEGAAFDSAGADALLLDMHEPELDPYVLAAALAAVTYRVLLIVELPDGRDTTARTLDIVSRGRVLTTDGTALHKITGETVDEQWEAVEFPADRQAWREALSGAAERGVHGLVVSADPRLLDLLRNPDAEIDRRDLQLAAG
jgi:hypothetical protein